jgi:uncharacterized cupredoxin-like copper-binding protein
MRPHHLLVLSAAAVTAALLAATGSARTDHPAMNVPVRISDSSCKVNYTSASHSYTRFVFGVTNVGKRAHGFDISTHYKTGLIKPGQEATIVADFTSPGSYRYACVSAHSTVKKGVFVVR